MGGSVGPLFVTGMASKEGWEVMGGNSFDEVGLALTIRKLDALPSKQVGVNRPGPGSEEGQGSTESP